MSVGSNGNVLRWSHWPDGDPNSITQRWVLHAAGAGYRIATVSNAEYMGVGTNGNIVRWSRDDATQVFKFIDRDGEWISLVEPTKGERVAVGSDGNVLRWAPTAGDEQKFKFLPVDGTCKNLPEAEQRASAEIAPPPKLTSAQPPVILKTEPELISTEYLPAALVDDPSYQNFVLQNRNTPFYRLERWRYWELPEGAYTLIRANSTIAKVRSVSTSFEKSRFDEQTSTVAFRAGYSGTIQGKAAIPNVGEVSASHTLSASFEKTDQTRKGSSEKTAGAENDTTTVSFPNPLANDTLWVTWQLVDEYKLFRGPKSDEAVWSKPVTVPARVFPDAFPRGDSSVEKALTDVNTEAGN